MEIINFITTPSVHEHRCLVRWYRISMTCALLVVAGMVIIQVIQCVQLYRAYAQNDVIQGKIARMTAAIEDHERLQQVHKELQEKIVTMRHLASSAQRMRAHIAALSKHLVENVVVHSCTLNDEEITLMIVARHGHDAMACIKRLRKAPFLVNVCMESVQPQGEYLLVGVRGQLTPEE